MIGFDAVALYPSMKEKNTASICKEQIVDIMGKGDIDLKGIDMEQVTLYIRMNKNLTSNLGRLWRYLPFGKKTGGVEPGMASIGARKSKEGNTQWCRLLTEVLIQQQPGVVQKIGRDTELYGDSYEKSYTDGLESSIPECTEQQLLAGPARRIEYHRN